MKGDNGLDYDALEKRQMAVRSFIGVEQNESVPYQKMLLKRNLRCHLALETAPMTEGGERGHEREVVTGRAAHQFLYISFNLKNDVFRNFLLGCIS